MENEQQSKAMTLLKTAVGGILKKVHAPFKQIITIVPEKSGRVSGTFRNQGNKVFNFEVSEQGAAISPITNKKTDSLFNDDYHEDSADLSEAELVVAAQRWDAVSVGYLKSFGIDVAA